MTYYKKFQCWTIDNDPDLVTPSESREDSQHPGKFESDPAYTSYMWNRIMSWGELPDSDATQELWDSYGIAWDSEFNDCSLPEVYRYDVTMLDRYYFSELNGISSVYLYEDNYGFVNIYEIRTTESLQDMFIGI